MNSPTLLRLRKAIDILDSRLLQLIAKRQLLSVAVAREKCRRRIAIQDKKREQEVIKDRREKGESLGIDRRVTEQLFTVLIAESKRIQGDRI
ncbi:chorismate mutase [Candidatus Gottesmanbacteria bacterium]|nr:chorismate mutase [Candidatus Gottesmanbacteria bacterium]